MKLRPIMFVGTGSDVGKSLINAGFCRIFKQDGYKPAPFKAQNMSLNSYATSDELEIGRAQAVQAEACGIPCMVEMNPILLKPSSDNRAQIVLNGKPYANKDAIDYFHNDDRAELINAAHSGFDKLSENFSPVVMEGAGSISEMNLWDKDLVNMPMAEYANAATYLIADIDKGGVFASIYGSIVLLPEKHRKLIKGVIINKFRGDERLFDKGKIMLEELTGVPVIGVLPYMRDVFIEQEDAVILDNQNKESAKDAKVKIGVILLKSMSNFTDFNTLERTPGVHLQYLSSPEMIKNVDIIILPGSKNTISDMQYLRNNGFVSAIWEHYKNDKPIYGICGGFQMMGQMIFDPLHIEGEIDAISGLGIFPTHSTIEEGKTTRQCTFTMNANTNSGSGYEIHSGTTTINSENMENFLCTLDNGAKDGYFINNKCWGTYIHGIFDNKCVIDSILHEINTEINALDDYQAEKEKNYDRLADYIRKHIDIRRVYQDLKI